MPPIAKFSRFLPNMHGQYDSPGRTASAACRAVTKNYRRNPKPVFYLMGTNSRGCGNGTNGDSRGRVGDYLNAGNDLNGLFE